MREEGAGRTQPGRRDKWRRPALRSIVSGSGMGNPGRLRASRVIVHLRNALVSPVGDLAVPLTFPLPTSTEVPRQGPVRADGYGSGWE